MLLLRAALILSPFYLGTAFLIFAMQSRHGEAWRSLIENLSNGIPLLGAARRALALARLSLALEALLSAGVNIVDAWPMAAEASASLTVRRAVAAWRPHLQEGRTPAELVRESRVFPEIFANFYASGEVSGKLDESLRRLHSYYHDEGTRKLEAIAAWTPRLIYGIVAIFIAIKVIGFYSNYFNQIGALTQGL
jgi:type II secretory pathway component PulF